MPSVWRYFCCICDSADDKRSYSAHYEFNSRRRNNRRTKSGKNTWARRSLLDNDQIELNEIPAEQVPYQMRSISTPTYDNDHASEDSFQARLLEHFAPKKRPTVNGVFEKSLDESSTSKTTFPWMDERFIPNGRNGTRLGISSVQMNARRSVTTVPQNNVIQNTNNNNARAHAITQYIKNHSFTEGKENARQHGSNVINSASNPANVQNIQNGQVLRNNFNTVPKEAANIRRPVRLGVSSNYSNKPMLLKAPTSDVGVRRVTPNQGHPRQDRIPKLEDYRSINSPSVATGNIAAVSHTRPKLMDIFPNSQFSSNESEVEVDVSYASEILFRKRPFEPSGNEVSLKRSAAPGIFSGNTSKYERLKPERAKSEKSKPDRTKSKAKYSNLSSESMYGYVPKVVQNVYASNALEGTKIDDFFMQRMHERQLENFASLDNKNQNSDEEPIIVTSLVESTGDLTVSGKNEDGDVKVEETFKAEQTAVSTAISSKILSDKSESKSKATDNTSSKDSSLGTNSLKTENVEHKTDYSDKKKDKVIMIDFPPNLANDKKIPIINNLKPHSSNESNSEISHRSTSGFKSKQATVGELLY